MHHKSFFIKLPSKSERMKAESLLLQHHSKLFFKAVAFVGKETLLLTSLSLRRSSLFGEEPQVF